MSDWLSILLQGCIFIEGCPEGYAVCNLFNLHLYCKKWSLLPVDFVAKAIVTISSTAILKVHFFF